MDSEEPIDGSTATPVEFRRSGIDALVKVLGPVGMARFLQQFAPRHDNYTATATATATAFWAIRPSDHRGLTDELGAKAGKSS